jgi:4-hydroxybenzoate polyprenyltransferase
VLARQSLAHQVALSDPTVGCGATALRMTEATGEVPTGGSGLGRQLVGLALATHLGPTLVVTGATTALAAAAGRGSGTMWVALAVLAGQCSVGWSNDAIDADRDRRVGRTSKPIVAGLVTERTVALASVAAFVCCIPLSLASGWRAATVHMVAVMAAIAYNLGLKSTILSPLPYAISFGLLPAFVTLGLPEGGWPRPIVMVATSLIGVGAHFINAVADASDDAVTGIKGLPQRLGPRRALEVGTIVLLVSTTIVALLAPHRRPALAAALCVVAVDLGVVASGAHGRHRLAWRLALLGGVGCLAVFVIGGDALVRVR